MPKAVDTSKPSAERGESTALHAVVYIARRLGIDLSYEELRRRYALPPSEPEPRMIIAIARDFGLDARLVRVKFKDLPRLSRSMPAMLRIEGGRALIVENAKEHPTHGLVALLRDPALPDGPQTPVDESKLSSMWQGEVLLFKRRQEQEGGDLHEHFGLAYLLRLVLRERRLFADVAIGALVNTLFALAPPFIIMITANRVVANQSMSTLEVLAGAVVLIIIFEVMLTYLRRRIMEVITSRVDGRLNLYVLEKLLRLPMSYFEHNAAGRTVNRISRLWQVRNFITQQLFGTFIDMVPLIGLIPVLFILEWRVASMVMVLALCIFVSVMFFVKPLARRHAAVVKAENARYAHLVETINGMRTIKTLALEGRRRREWDGLVAEMISSKFTFSRMAANVPTVTLPFERLMYAGALMMAAYLILTTPETMSIGGLFAFAMLSNRIGSPLVQLAKMQLELAEIRGSIHELGVVMNHPPEDAREDAGSRQPVEGRVDFADVRFRYSKDAPYALDGVSFSLQPGMSLGIMGRSGSGKTTVTRLLQRLHTEYSGLIKLDGMDLREINLSHLRTSVGVVAQESFLFRGSVRENISVARPDATMAQIVRAAQLAGAEEFVERLPRGYDTLLEEGASNLSGGQRQRLAIARALITDPPILVLDEATSALDAESEAIVGANLKRIAQGRTVITISHRLSMLVDSDAILVLDRGKVYDLGTHDELLDRCDIYKQLWYQQNRHIERAHRSTTAAAIGQG